MDQLKKDKIRQTVRINYARVAQAGNSGCCTTSSCCTPRGVPAADAVSVQLGYSNEDVSVAPEESNMGLGCGNPQILASLKPGEIVIDLGSGGGFDCFLAARAVEETGKVIGVDMTPEMISKARENAVKAGFKNVEFRLGEIEHFPLADESVDVIISNCVINLSPEKHKVFDDAFRVLRSGGRLAVSDVVATAELPEEVKNDLALHCGCMAGASLIGDVEVMLKKSGFRDIRIRPKDESREFIKTWAPGRNVEDYVVSATIEAVKP
jgi:arsenite methyltransferase